MASVATPPSILSASLNADVPAEHGDWFVARLEAGWCRIGRREGIHYRRVSLARDDVAGFVFWTRDAGRFVPALDLVRARGYAFTLQFAITGHPAADPARIPARQAVTGAHALAQRFGGRAVVWRYDPIVLAADTPPDWHLQHFAALARDLAGATDEVAIAFARPGGRRREATEPPQWSDADRRALVRALASHAAAHGMRLTLCAQPDYLVPGAAPARCIDLRRLRDMGATDVDAGSAGFVPGCLCARSIDLGDSEGALPAFAGALPKRRRRRAPDPRRELLIEPAARFLRVAPQALPF